MTECTGAGPLDDVKTNKHTYSSTKLLTRVTVAEKLVFVNPFWWNNHLFIVLFAVSSWFVPRASLTVNIDLGDVTKWYYSTVPYSCGIWEKESIIGVKIPTFWSTIQWETRQASFPTGTVDPQVGIFLSPLNTNNGFYLSYMDTHGRLLYSIPLSQKWLILFHAHHSIPYFLFQNKLLKNPESIQNNVTLIELWCHLTTMSRNYNTTNVQATRDSLGKITWVR